MSSQIEKIKKYLEQNIVDQSKYFSSLKKALKYIQLGTATIEYQIELDSCWEGEKVSKGTGKTIQEAYKNAIGDFQEQNDRVDGQWNHFGMVIVSFKNKQLYRVCFWDIFPNKEYDILDKVKDKLVKND